jgi:cell division protein FtsI/penicillin-binding protein 2
MGATLAAVVNGGTYYKPTLVDSYVTEDGIKQPKLPEISRSNVIKPTTSQQVVDMMQNVISKNYLVYGMTKPDPAYMVGGKTGTAQVARPNKEGGGYYDDRFNGTFMGFVGGDSPQYVVVVRVNEPKIGGYAGSKAAAPIFGKLVNMLINNSSVTPRR